MIADFFRKLLKGNLFRKFRDQILTYVPDLTDSPTQRSVLRSEEDEQNEEHVVTEKSGSDTGILRSEGVIVHPEL